MATNSIISAVTTAWKSGHNIDDKEKAKIQSKWDQATSAEREEAMNWFREKCPTQIKDERVTCNNFIRMFIDRPIVDPQIAAREREIAQRSGLLGMLRKGTDTAPTALDAWTSAHLQSPPELGDAGGVGSLGTSRAPSQPLGIGGLGAYGKGRSDGGLGKIDLGGLGGPKHVVPAKPAVDKKGLDKDIIGRVIRRHWAQIKWAYESELTKKPNLKGKVDCKFTINPDGTVQDIEPKYDEGLQDPEFQRKFKEAFSKIKFPAPGAEMKEEHYAFIFKAG